MVGSKTTLMEGLILRGRMNKLINYFKKIFSIEYWHIGILDLSNMGDLEIRDIVKYSKIQWLNYTYSDRFFADPFLLKKDEDSIFILAEEYLLDERKGKIVELEVDRSSLRIKNRFLLLCEDTHLSFPYFNQGKLYPENYRSGHFYSYSINREMQKDEIIDLPLIDPIIFVKDNVKYLFSSFPDRPFSNERLFYFDGAKWKEHPCSPIQRDKRYSRMAGHLFWHKGKLYRPVQDCSNGYGVGIHIMVVKKLSKELYSEELVCSLDSSMEKRFNQGLHTFNFEGDIVLIDGYSFKPHIIRRLITTMKRRILNRKNFWI